MNFLTGLVIVLALYAGATGYLTRSDHRLCRRSLPLEGEDGLMEGDVFYKIDGYRIYLQGDAEPVLRPTTRGMTIDLVVIRDGEQVVLEDFPMTRQTYTDRAVAVLYRLWPLSSGHSARGSRCSTWLQYAWYQAVDFVQLVWFSLVQLVYRAGASMRI